MHWRKKPFENIVGKKENAGNQHFLLFPQCFLSYKRQLQHFEYHLSSANVFDLGKPKILSSSKGLKLVIVRLRVRCYLTDDFCFSIGYKNCEKGRYCWLPAFSLFQQ